MDLTIERHDGVLTVALSGRLHVTASAALAEALEDAIGDSDRTVILDFAGVDFIGSAGLRVVLSTATCLEKRGGELVLSGVSDPIRRVLRITNIEPFLTIHETPAGAHARAAGRQPEFEHRAP